MRSVFIERMSSHLATPWTVARQAPLGFSRQECWSGLPFPTPGDLSNPGIESWSPSLQTDSLPSEPPGKPTWGGRVLQIIPWIFDCIFYPVLLCLKPPCRGHSVIRNGMSLRVNLGPSWNMTVLNSVHVNKCF